MDKKYYVDLKEARLTRSDELLEEAKYLLEKQAYKSANNRAFYAIEQGIKALLAEKQIDVLTHNGVVKQFNYEYIHNGNGIFTKDDYKIITSAEQIRQSSDYDDFYIASKQDTEILVQNAKMLNKKIHDYFSNKNSTE